MCLVFGEKKDPEEDVVRFIEDTVRSQLCEIVRTLPCTIQRARADGTTQVIQARTAAARRGSRQLGVEDLLFLMRADHAKVSRLRAYLGWKDVRAKVREAETDDGPDPVEPIVPEGALISF